MPVRVIIALLLTTFFLPSALARADNPQLVASVGANDAFTISLRDPSGNPVTHVENGTYDIVVHDLSELHNFHLLGPGIDKATSVPDKEEVVWTVTFTDQRYRFQCDPHLTVMRGNFTAGTPPPLPPAKLAGAVGPKKTISLRSASGSKVKTLAAGDVVLTVSDRSRVDNFHLTGKGVNRKTGVAFRGRATWTLTLAAGRYTYRSDRHPALRGSFTVSESS